MPSKIITALRLTGGWLARRPGYMLLTAGDEAIAAEPPERFRLAWLEIMAISLGWGACAPELYSWTWGSFASPTGLTFVPVAIVLAVGMGWLYLRSVLALAEVLGGEGPGRSVAAAVIVAIWTLFLLDLKAYDPDFPYYLPHMLQWLRPRMMFRALLLAPLWGGWAMLITCQFCKPGERTSAPVAAFARGCGPLTATAVLAVLLPVTVLYFNHLPWTQLGISATAVIVAGAGGAVLCRIRGGLCRRALLAANMLTQMGFMLAYLANR